MKAWKMLDEGTMNMCKTPMKEPDKELDLPPPNKIHSLYC
jgi:hypothetical protein